MRSLPWRRLLGSGLGLALLAASAPPQQPLLPLDLDRGASGLGLALRRVGTSGRVLQVTAHPDDEHNGLLVRLSRGLGLRTGLLTLTRGEGGQNQIGPELGPALGLLRSEELMALHRHDAVEQYFGRAYEFGYSFSVEETFAKWGREETLGDIVRVLRAFRPDVVLTLPLGGGGGGQHHQATARLTLEAFRAAADSSRYPEQIEQGLRPWQALKLYAGGVGGGAEGVDGTLVRVPVGVYDPILGMSWQQLGARARALHRCQGAAQLGADPGPAEAVFTLVDAEPKPGGREGDILDGLESSLLGLARFAPAEAPVVAALAALQEKAGVARGSFDPVAPEQSLPPLADELRFLRGLRGLLGAQLKDPLARVEIEERLAEEEADLERAIVLAQGLELEARVDDGLVTPGQRFGVVVSLWNNGRSPIDSDAVEVEAPAGWAVVRGDEGGTGAPGAARHARFAVTVSSDAAPSRPYWRRAADRDRNELLTNADETLPWSPPLLVARVRCRVAGEELTLRAAAAHRYPGRFVGGEKRHALAVVPELALSLSPEIAALPLGPGRRTLELRVAVRSERTAGGTAGVRIEAPAGWEVEPEAAALAFAFEGEELSARFRARPPRTLAPGSMMLRAVAVRDGREYREGLQVVEYDHVERRQLVRPAETRVVALEVATPRGAEIGYVMGSGDAGFEALRGLGLAVSLLSAEDVAFGELSRFTTIVTGIRAYETRPELRAAQARLLRWVEKGGHLVVQYNRDAFNRLAPSPSAPGASGATASPFAPFPALVTSARVSDETAPLRRLRPTHPLLVSPNRLSDADFEGWVQERAIQLLEARDPRYVELLAASDPFALNPGEKRGLLVDAALGAGTWTYVGLALFRQLPAGVPGGYRLLANLVARGARDRARPLPGSISERR